MKGTRRWVRTAQCLFPSWLRPALAMAAILTVACSGSPRGVRVGEEGVLAWPQRLEYWGETMPLFPTDAHLKAFINAVMAQDRIGYRQALVGALPVKVGTRVLVIDRASVGTEKVRVLEGPYASQAGYVGADWIRKP